mmetsp:Transcript_21894/g.70740  ORF Transcript_21894/g.70740 Transcript_21894/m.70740 type:complete len:1233 (+) Transcript_21894:79-3777(+)
MYSFAAWEAAKDKVAAAAIANAAELPAIARCFYPSGTSAQAAEEWVSLANGIAQAAETWAAPGADAGALAAAKLQLEAFMAKLEARLTTASFLVGERLTVADVAALSPLLPLLRSSVPAGARGAAVARWAVTVSGALQKGFGGPLKLCASEGGDWAPPSGAAGSTAPPAAAAAPGGGDAAEQELDPEKKRKKEEKLAKKAALKAKAEAKEKKRAEEAAAKENSTAAPKKEKKVKAAPEEDPIEKEAMSRAGATKQGDKKQMTEEMPKAYNPRLVEACWYSWWEEQKFFTPKQGSNKPKFVIVIPPPNVTGALHIGHALTNSIQDTIVRWRRMSGYEALWVPGTDHAGIATQTIVEKKLKKERGITRHELGRDAFLEETHKWKEQYGGKICTQLRRLGGSLDWSRERFTMDEMLSKSVQAAFLKMHDKGLIYRDNRLVNWCTRLKTAISDIEVDYIDVPPFSKLSVPGYTKEVEFGVLTSFAYPLESGDGEIVVATTRVETMLGDTAVAVHPEDPRYAALHGKCVIHPFNGRKIPIITDAELVDMSFGTGAVKITPAHDPNDFATGKRHDLAFINVFSETGDIVSGPEGAEFAGLPRFEARVKVTEALEAKGLFRGKSGNEMRLGICSRSKDVIEPMLKPQWWVSCGQMAADACQAVRDKRLEIIPENFEAVWFRWLENIRDWCISRQLWWGHRIPAYYVKLRENAGEQGTASEHLDRWIVAPTPEEALALASQRFGSSAVESVEQDEDVLDTWFSSGLFPFSVMGWPEKTPDMEDFYPGALLETGHDILFFWVARMVMMGMTLTDTVPFKQVYLHAMVRDAHGRKMSKSLGNVIDPLQVIEGISLEDLHETLHAGNLEEKEIERAKKGQKADYPTGIPECGTDALRFALAAYTAQGRDVNLDILRVVGYRHWCNKLWNAIRFAMINLGPGFVPDREVNFAALPLQCRWILTRLSAACATANAELERYGLSPATTAIYALWQYEVCDIFIELMKPIMSGSDAAAQKDVRNTLYICLERGLRLLHPFMPFVTEELWQRLPRAAGCEEVASIMLAPYPVEEPTWKDQDAEAGQELMFTVVKAVRAVRADYNLLPKTKSTIFVLCRGEESAAKLGAWSDTLATLSMSSSCTILRSSKGESPPPGCGVRVISDNLSVYILLKGVIDAEAEIKKLAKKRDQLANSLASLRKTMGMPGYAERVPEKVQTENKEKEAKIENEMGECERATSDFQSLLAAQ